MFTSNWKATRSLQEKVYALHNSDWKLYTHVPGYVECYMYTSANEYIQKSVFAWFIISIFSDMLLIPYIATPMMELSSWHVVAELRNLYQLMNYPQLRASKHIWIKKYNRNLAAISNIYLISPQVFESLIFQQLKCLNTIYSVGLWPITPYQLMIKQLKAWDKRSPTPYVAAVCHWFALQWQVYCLNHATNDTTIRL